MKKLFRSIRHYFKRRRQEKQLRREIAEAANKARDDRDDWGDRQW